MERMKQQTAVDWLVKQLGLAFELENYQSEINQANEMFEQQIKDAWNNGFREFYDGSSTPEQYYNETFKSE
jgi:hypothetical protein